LSSDIFDQLVKITINQNNHFYINIKKNNTNLFLNKKERQKICLFLEFSNLLDEKSLLKLSQIGFLKLVLLMKFFQKLCVVLPLVLPEPLLADHGTTLKVAEMLEITIFLVAQSSMPAIKPTSPVRFSVLALIKKFVEKLLKLSTLFNSLNLMSVSTTITIANTREITIPNFVFRHF